MNVLVVLKNASEAKRLRQIQATNRHRRDAKDVERAGIDPPPLA
jgi:hypothetical protein